MTRRLRVLALVLPALLVLSACGGSGGDSPQDALAGAKKQLDQTSGVHLLLSTDKLPSGVDGILKADGVGTHDPAFDGKVKVQASGFSADIPVVAVGGDVYAKLPFTLTYSTIDPADYNAPDPAVLMDPDKGLSTWLSEATDVTKGDQVRDGSDVLTSYHGTLSGKAVAGIIPTAAADADFDATFTIDKRGLLRRAKLTGPFYGTDHDSLTYVVDFSDYGTSKDITKP
jgi:lipoprotein LprG